MILSNSFFITRKEFPNDEESLSAKLLIKSGMIYKNDSGIYTYLPIGLKVIENIKKIIKEEFNKVNAEEVLMPSLIDCESFSYSKRNMAFESEIFKLTGRNNKDYMLCPTHEELFSILVRQKIRSYKDLHFTLFQISNKYRDEEKPKYGLTRKKEFLMADAYSFDADESGLDVSYDKMFQVFKRIFNRLNLNTIVVSNDAEDMLGESSEEFQVICDYGDNEVVKCNNCTYATNIEYASSSNIYKKEEKNILAKKLVYTPNKKTIKEISDFLQIEPKNIIKSIIIKVDEKYVMLLLRGNSEINFKKIEKIYPNRIITIPNSEELEKIGTKVGYIGPIKSTMEIIADNEIKTIENAVCGSNKENYHYINVNPNIDFKINRYADIKLFDNNSLCPRCKNKCSIKKGIEVGHIFKLEDNYSGNYNLKYVDEVNEMNYVHMGSYGIGIDRCMGAIVETSNDEKGIIWPIEVSPYKVAIIVVNVNDKEVMKYARTLHDKLEKLNIDTILDDRKETVGIKFNDMDLIGVPIRITVGTNLTNGIVELKMRNEEKIEEVDSRSIILKIEDILEKNKS